MRSRVTKLDLNQPEDKGYLASNHLEHWNHDLKNPINRAQAYAIVFDFVEKLVNLQRYEEMPNQSEGNRPSQEIVVVDFCEDWFGDKIQISYAQLLGALVRLEIETSTALLFSRVDKDKGLILNLMKEISD